MQLCFVSRMPHFWALGGRRTEVFEPVRVPTPARGVIEATDALLPYSLRPQELGELPRVPRRAVAIADLLVGGLPASSCQD